MSRAYEDPSESIVSGGVINAIITWVRARRLEAFRSGCGSKSVGFTPTGTEHCAK